MTVNENILLGDCVEVTNSCMKDFMLMLLDVVMEMSYSHSFLNENWVHLKEFSGF